MESKDLKIDFAKLCNARNIHVAQVGERHYRENWVCVPCPFCTGQEGNHLGFNPRANVFTCFRCGRHGKYEALGALLGISKKEAYEVAKGYTIDKWTSLGEISENAELERKRNERNSQASYEGDDESSFTVPGKRELLRLHRDYLIGRDYDPDRIRRLWDIRCVGKTGRYSYRIVIPITYGNRVVSFTTRDVTGMAADRYLACPPADALRHHKHCVYGSDQSDYKTCLVVEGPFGVWRIGRGTVGTCGTGWTHEQAKIIATYRKSYIVFDPEEKEAQQRAEKLSIMLASYMEHHSYVVQGHGAKGRDTGELTTDEVKELRKLLKR